MGLEQRIKALEKTRSAALASISMQLEGEKCVNSDLLGALLYFIEEQAKNGAEAKICAFSIAPGFRPSGAAWEEFYSILKGAENG